MTLYFYDLETTGFNPRQGRIMQFAGQRTSLDLEPIGEPDNLLIKITDDILPDPDAVLITGITPQKTLKEGLSEAEFCRYFATKINQPGTIFMGYNSIRFDDEFMRHLFYRNFYDAYEWQWQDGNSRWDLLDVVRMTRALRPAGIKWPFASDGSPSNQLGLLTSINKLEHANAHDALSDVQATIDLAKLINAKQPKLFKFLLKLRTKQAVADLVLAPEPFVYTSGKYSSQFEKTTVAVTIAEHPQAGAVLVYDLRFNPEDYSQLSVTELAAAWRRRDPAEGPILPVKTLKFNRSPAVAPLSVLDEASKKRLKLDMKLITNNHEKLKKLHDWPAKLLAALEVLDKAQQNRLLTDEQDVDDQLYTAFFDQSDKRIMNLIRAAEPEELSDLTTNFKDDRLKVMLPLYKARNFSSYLTEDEAENWHRFKHNKLLSDGDNSKLGKYFARLEELKAIHKGNKTKLHLLKDLEIYGQNVLKKAS